MDQPQQINLTRIKRKLGVLFTMKSAINRKTSSVGMGIFLFGASPRSGLQNIWKNISRFTPIMRGLCAVHRKAIELKSPYKEYSIGKRFDRKASQTLTSELAQRGSSKTRGNSGLVIASHYLI
jgi:hypothetical protein